MTVYEVRSDDEGLEAVYTDREDAERYARLLRVELEVVAHVVEVEKEP